MIRYPFQHELVILPEQEFPFEDKLVLQPSYVYNEFSYIRKNRLLYWNSNQYPEALGHEINCIFIEQGNGQQTTSKNSPYIKAPTHRKQCRISIINILANNELSYYVYNIHQNWSWCSPQAPTWRIAMMPRTSSATSDCRAGIMTFQI